MKREMSTLAATKMDKLEKIFQEHYIYILGNCLEENLFVRVIQMTKREFFEGIAEVMIVFISVILMIAFS